MKVVLFCGGQGMRLRGYLDEIPKPMVPLGYRPILWHVMRYYAHYGHTEFILCLGHRADAIKRFFLEYQEEISNDFVLHGADSGVQLLNRDIENWTVSFVDTGIHTEIGERLRRVRPHLEGEEIFLANYADAVVDLDHDSYVSDFLRRDMVASLVAVRPPQSYHLLEIDSKARVESLKSMHESDIWLNGGYFVFRSEVFDYIERGDDLVTDTFPRLAKKQELHAHLFDGFFGPMDTFKDKSRLDALYEHGQAPWVVWKDHHVNGH